MRRFSARVEVWLRPGIADPEGATIERALPALGIDDVGELRAGRAFRFVVDAPDQAAARSRAEELAHRLLANPVIEDATVELDPSSVPSVASPRGGRPATDPATDPDPDPDPASAATSDPAGHPAPNPGRA